jgi:hypothetical protein
MHDIAKNVPTFRQTHSLVLKGVFPFKHTRYEYNVNKYHNASILHIVCDNNNKYPYKA